MLGNNQTTNKVKRILIPITGTAAGRYFLPEDPEIERYTIVGVSASLSAPTLEDISRNTPYTEGNNVVKIVRENGGLVKRSFLTLYSNDKTILLDNFPIKALFNRNSATNNRIYPITGKISTRNSYISIPGRIVFAAGEAETFYLNFYYI
jgi:hypothetical protein